MDYPKFIVSNQKEVSISIQRVNIIYHTVKPVFSSHSKKDQNLAFNTVLIIAYCRSKVLQSALLEHSAILWTFIKLSFVVKSFVLYIFEWPF